MAASRPFVPALLAIAVLALPAACSREEAPPRMPNAAEATAPVADAAPASAPETVAPARAKDEMIKVMEGFRTMKSFHADMSSTTPKGDMTMDVDFVAPDRYRMKTPTGTQHVIGDTMYLTMNGRTMKAAMPKGQIPDYRDPAQFEAHNATMTVESLGRDSLDGQATRKFLVRNTQPRPSESTIWVNGDGYPLKIDVSSQDTRTTIRYSRFNDPSIRVDPPQ